MHRHLSNIDCLTACTACLVCFISTVNGCSKEKKPWKTGTSSGHITNLKQSISETFDIYGAMAKPTKHFANQMSVGQLLFDQKTLGPFAALTNTINQSQIISIFQFFNFIFCRVFFYYLSLF